MRFAYYIAQKLRGKNNASFSRTVVRLAIIAVSISILVVILSFGILFGFKKEIREKVSGYAGHISISNFELSRGSEKASLEIDEQMMRQLSQIPNIKQVEPFLNKAGILKADSLLEGIIFRGLGANYPLDFFEGHLIRGSLPVYTDSSDSYDILISAHTANVLQADTGHRLNLYFVEAGDVKRRKVKVKGIYNTGLETFDKQFALCDLRMLQRVVGQSYDVASGYELLVHDFDQLEASTEAVDKQISALLRAVHVKDQYFTMFQWLEIVDSNVLIIIVLMFVVAMINIITVLLILIIERIPMIGLFKSMGAKDVKIMQIFSWQGLFILLGGLLIGNALAILFSELQMKYHLIKLSPETYYMDAVPFHLPLETLILINVVTIVLAYLFTWLPSLMISRISPARSIRFK